MTERRPEKHRATLAELRGLGMEIGHDCRIVGKIEPDHPSWIHLGERVMLGGQSRIITHGPIRPFRDDPHVHIGDLVYVGHRCLILCGTRIGRCSLIGAASVVAGEYDPYTIYAGNPARRIRSITALELLRYFTGRFLMEKLNSPTIDYSLLTREDVLWVLGLPRDEIVDDDPASPLIAAGWEDMTVEEMLACYDIDPSVPGAGVSA